jgi:arylsulfatase A-like enzyme
MQAHLLGGNARNIQVMKFGKGKENILRRACFFMLAFGLAVTCGCSSQPEPGPPNILLIVVDTLRADHLGCYGYERDTSPNIDAFSRTGVLFENAYCQMPTTGPSHASIFTSHYPKSHGVIKNGHILPDTLPTLAEILKNNGYATAAVVSSFPLSSKFGYSRGFDYYEEQFPDGLGTGPNNANWAGHAVEGAFDQRANITTREAAAWINQNDRNPFFLFVHYFDPHSPYSPPLKYLRKFLKESKTPEEDILVGYDGEIVFVDAEIQKLVEIIKEERLDSNTLIIITSDHGEGLGQHGEMHHGVFLYEEQTRIPLIMSFPGVLPQGLRLKSVVQTVDILPTILSLVGLKYEGGFSGSSLVKTMRGQEDYLDNPAFLQRQHYSTQKTPQGREAIGEKLAIRRRDTKYIWAPEEGTEELYDLSEDPNELANIVSSRRETADDMRSMIENWVNTESKQTREQHIDEDSRRKLEALGYIE